MRTISEAIIHCTATPTDMDIGVAEITRWHIRRGFDGCGYHRVIRRDGTVEWGRPFSKFGAHTKGRNIYSIAVALVGGLNDDGDPDCNFTRAQWDALSNELEWYEYQFGNLDISGHREWADKACPTFDARAYGGNHANS